jgi:sigma-E factor negative regulatory protein RseC
MIEERARVLAVDGRRASVQVERRSTCGGCQARGGCGTGLIAEWLPRRQLVFELDNGVEAEPGDWVIVGLEETRLQRYAVLLYALPLVGLLVGAVAGQSLASAWGLSSELASVALGLIGTAAALVYVAGRSRSITTNDSGVRLLRLAGPGADPGSGSPVAFTWHGGPHDKGMKP